MPTIADYLDDAPKRKIDNFQVDLYYLHVPRAIVKRAETEYVEAQENALDRPSNSLRENISTALFASALLPKPDNYEGTSIEYNTYHIFGGSPGVDDTILKDLASQPDPMSWVNRISLWVSDGAPLLDVALGKMWHGDTTLPDALSTMGNNEVLKQKNPELSKGFLEASTQLYDHVNPQGKPYGPSFPASIAKRKMQGRGFANVNRAYKDGRGYSNQFLKQFTPEQRQAAIKHYRENYFQPEVEDNDYKDNLWGWLDQNPGLRGALRYATPWLAYGIPLSAIGSMMGTNALWGPTILGAVGAGAYGYGVGSGYLSDFAENNPFGQMLDTIHSTANKPLGSIVNYLNEGAGRVFNRVNVDDDWRQENRREKPAPTTTPTKGTPVATYTSSMGPEVHTQETPKVVMAPKPMQLLPYETQPEFNNPLSIS